MHRAREPGAQRSRGRVTVARSLWAPRSHGHGAGGWSGPKAGITPAFTQRVVRPRCGGTHVRGGGRRGRDVERVEVRGKGEVIYHTRSAANGRHFRCRAGGRWETRGRREGRRRGRQDWTRVALWERRLSFQGNGPLGACSRFAANGRLFSVSTPRYERVMSLRSENRSAGPTRGVHCPRGNPRLAANGRPFGVSTPKCEQGMSLRSGPRSASPTRVIIFPRGNTRLAANGRSFRVRETRNAAGVHLGHGSRCIADGCPRGALTNRGTVAARDTGGRDCACAVLVSCAPFPRCLVRGHRSRTAANGRPSRDEKIDRRIGAGPIGDRGRADRPYRRRPGTVRVQERGSRRVQGRARSRCPEGFQCGRSRGPHCAFTRARRLPWKRRRPIPIPPHGPPAVRRSRTPAAPQPRPGQGRRRWASGDRRRGVQVATAQPRAARRRPGDPRGDPRPARRAACARASRGGFEPPPRLRVKFQRRGSVGA